MVKKFKCAGSTYIIPGRGTVKQAKAGLKKESKETLKYIEDIRKDVGLTPIQKQRVAELKRIIRSC